MRVHICSQETEAGVFMRGHTYSQGTEAGVFMKVHICSQGADREETLGNSRSVRKVRDPQRQVMGEQTPIAIL